jgi:hypothetical protein
MSVPFHRTETAFKTLDFPHFLLSIGSEKLFGNFFRFLSSAFSAIARATFGFGEVGRFAVVVLEMDSREEITMVFRTC